MLVSEIMKTVNATLLTKDLPGQRDISHAFSADMMSDVLAYADSHASDHRPVQSPDHTHRRNAGYQLRFVRPGQKTRRTVPCNGKKERHYCAMLQSEYV